MGEPNVDRMIARMGSHHFSEWVAFSQLEPFGPRVDDIHFGKLMAVLANLHTTKGRRFAPRDFMLVDERHRKAASSPEEMVEVARAITASLGGRDMRKKDA